VRKGSADVCIPAGEQCFAMPNARQSGFNNSARLTFGSSTSQDATVRSAQPGARCTQCFLGRMHSPHFLHRRGPAGLGGLNGLECISIISNVARSVPSKP
jgi:hypothetical protein